MTAPHPDRRASPGTTDLRPRSDRRAAGTRTGIVMILVGLFLALGGFVVVPHVTSTRPGAGEATARGTVVDVRESTGRSGSRQCSPEATFTVDGTTYSARATSSSSGCPSVGSSTTVIYSTADPTDARVPLSTGTLLPLVVLPLAGVVLVVLGIRAVAVGLRRLSE